MKVRLLCEIEADVIDREELESIQNRIDKGKSLKGVERLWTTILKEKLVKICPCPVYANRKMDIKVKYYEQEEEIQHFQLGDTAYMIDEDYRFFESTVNRISLSKGKYFYETTDVDFECKDIGERVFRSKQEREIRLELMS